MTDGIWTRRLPPLPGELLSSCLARNAFAHWLPPYRFLNMVWERDPVWDRDFDRDPEELLRVDRRTGANTWMDDIASGLGIAQEAVRDATLAGWREALGTDASKGATDSRLILSAGVHHRTRTRHALQFCPDCLADGIPHFRKAWRLGFSTWCAVHERTLRDACPRCGEAVVPHRSMTSRIIDCHHCGKAITERGREGTGTQVPVLARRLQERLLDVLAQAGDGMGDQTSPRSGRDGLPLMVRALIAVSSPPSVHDALRQILGLAPAMADGFDRRRFEHARLAVRIPWLETVAAWMDDWPCNFLIGTEAIGASGRTFARCRMPPALAEQVARLPARRKPPRRPWEPLLDEPVINRLRRQDRTAYHALRARRIMNAIG